MPINAKQMLLQLTRIFADEIRNHEPVQNRMKHVHPSIVYRNALGPILRTNAHKMFLPLLQQLNRFYDNWRVNALEPKHRLLGGLLQLFIGDMFVPCETRRNQTERPHAGARSEKIAAGSFHNNPSFAEIRSSALISYGHFDFPKAILIFLLLDFLLSEFLECFAGFVCTPVQSEYDRRIQEIWHCHWLPFTRLCDGVKRLQCF